MFCRGQGKSIAPSITFRKKTEVEWTELSAGAPVATVSPQDSRSDKTIRATLWNDKEMSIHLNHSHNNQRRALKSLTETTWTAGGTCRPLRLSSPCFNNSPCDFSWKYAVTVQSLLLSINKQNRDPCFDSKKEGGDLTINSLMQCLDQISVPGFM